ncbi:4Fe-4S dicluster domain-containing protein [Thiohalobacter thiocyanaticus]|uniref:Sulfite reductase subunit A n=1 Tax=Thiohalobacter thiocyanaticus TaxID=585455 RepID=A0A426QM68_9GAMM|nr:4Fe-4S dicluster domain-containing protein [Thiohalobacter thiocyanaticus]RRQ22863.1 sulfite reductase subunit A [Thiohalobacter thiocyanaticus]
MATGGASPGWRGFLPREAFDTLLRALEAAGYECIGPRVEDGAILYRGLSAGSDLPQGVEEAQAPGHYRLQHTDTPRCFAWAVGPQAIKPHLFTPREALWETERDADGRLTFRPVEPGPRPLAIIGVRACDLAALALQDQHFLRAGNADPYYAHRREGLFLVAVNCTHPAATCFCVSTGDGPQAGDDCDLALDELDEGYAVRAASSKGETIVQQLPLQALTEAQQAQIGREREAARSAQQRTMPAGNLRDHLFNAWEHPRWAQVAERCLSCGNCTSVCPTCFCHQQVDVPTLDGGNATHYREWDSCFTQNHSYIHGITLRPDTRSRYRQWLTHKLGSWHDQYGRSGCVGCGRCITWCPVGIDITEEVSALLAEAGK